MESDKIKVNFEDSKFNVSYDGNSDGENSVKISLNLKETLDELRNKAQDGSVGEPLSVSMDGSKVIIKGDLNKDGESFIDIEIDLFEALDESGVV